MKLYFNGCSTTYGDELPEDIRASACWAGQVAAHYNAEFLNDSTRGGSNQRTLSRTMLHLNKFDKFYIQWTYAERFTLHDANNWFEANFQKKLTHDYFRNKDHFMKLGKLYYAYWSHSLFEFKKWLEQIILLQNLFKQHNKSYLMFSCVPNDFEVYTCARSEFISKFSKISDIKNFDDEQIYEQYDQIQTLLGLIDFDTFIAPDKMYGIELIRGTDQGPGGHPMVEGHTRVANYIIEYDKNLSK